MLCFNSKDTAFKSITGAIATNASVKFRISLPRSTKCCGAKLVVHKENECDIAYQMYWAGMNGDDYEWWELDFCATTAGLYWYKFELDTPWGQSYIANAGNGEGEIHAYGDHFQLTVFDSEFKTPDWLKGGLIYQIFPDRFNKSKEKKGEIPSGRIIHDNWDEQPLWRANEDGKILNNDFFGGDLKGIEEKLPYLCDIGVTCIYLNPIFEAYSNHRYDTGDYKKVDPMLGNEEDLRELCKKADKKGIKIIIDGVFSHTGCDSKYFNKQNRYPAIGAYNSEESPYFSWYKFLQWPDKYHSWWGIDILPEINEEDEGFLEYICGKNGVIEKWLDCGIYGWRLDVADELPDVFLDSLRCAVKGKNKDAVIIGEVWEDATTKFSYGKRRRYLLGHQLDSVMNYPACDSILDFIRYGGGKNFVDSISDILDKYPPQVVSVLMNHIGTHDTERAITMLGGEYCDGHNREWQSKKSMTKEQYSHGMKMLKLASAIQYTIPGVPSLYYGDEAGLEGYRDPFNRYCFPWGSENSELEKWYKKLGAMRKHFGVFKDGTFKVLHADENVVVFVRDSIDSSVLVAVNRGECDVSIELPKEWRNSLNVISGLLQKDLKQINTMTAVILVKSNTVQ